MSNGFGTHKDSRDAAAPPPPQPRVAPPASGSVIVATGNGLGATASAGVVPTGQASREHRHHHSDPRTVAEARQPCPHCGRSFRPGVVERHIKVCQKVSTANEQQSRQRIVYDSRRHRLKGTPFETFAEHAALRLDATSPPPAKLSGNSPTAMEAQPSIPVPTEPTLLSTTTCGTLTEAQIADLAPRLWRSVSESVIPQQHVLPTMAVANAPQAVADNMSSPRCDRRGLLERARLRAKMSQHPEYAALAASPGGGASTDVVVVAGVSPQGRNRQCRDKQMADLRAQLQASTTRLRPEVAPLEPGSGRTAHRVRDGVEGSSSRGAASCSPSSMLGRGRSTEALRRTASIGAAAGTSGVSVTCGTVSGTAARSTISDAGSRSGSRGLSARCGGRARHRVHSCHSDYNGGHGSASFQLMAGVHQLAGGMHGTNMPGS